MKCPDCDVEMESVLDEIDGDAKNREENIRKTIAEFSKNSDQQVAAQNKLTEALFKMSLIEHMMNAFKTPDTGLPHVYVGGKKRIYDIYECPKCGRCEMRRRVDKEVEKKLTDFTDKTISTQ